MEGLEGRNPFPNAISMRLGCCGALDQGREAAGGIV
jgi:hypothetical protein